MDRRRGVGARHNDDDLSALLEAYCVDSPPGEGGGAGDAAPAASVAVETGGGRGAVHTPGPAVFGDGTSLRASARKPLRGEGSPGGVSCPPDRDESPIREAQAVTDEFLSKLEREAALEARGRCEANERLRWGLEAVGEATIRDGMAAHFGVMDMRRAVVEHPALAARCGELVEALERARAENDALKAAAAGNARDLRRLLDCADDDPAKKITDARVRAYRARAGGTAHVQPPGTSAVAHMIEECRQKFKASDAEKRGLEDGLRASADLRRRVSRLRVEAGEADERSERKGVMLEELAGVVDAFAARWLSAEVIATQACDELETEKETAHRLTTLLGEADRRADTLQTSLDESNAKLISWLHEHGDEVQLRSRNADLTDDLDSAKRRAKALEEELSETAEKNIALREEVSAATARGNVLGEELAKVGERLEEAAAALSARDAEVAGLLTQLSTTTQHARELRDRAAAACGVQSECKDLQFHLDKAQARGNRAEKLEVVADRLREENQALSRRFDIIAEKLGLSEAEKALRDENTRLNAALKAVQPARLAMQEAVRQLADEHDQLVSSVSRQASRVDLKVDAEVQTDETPAGELDSGVEARRTRRGFDQRLSSDGLQKGQKSPASPTGRKRSRTFTALTSSGKQQARQVEWYRLQQVYEKATAALDEVQKRLRDPTSGFDSDTSDLTPLALLELTKLAAVQAARPADATAVMQHTAAMARLSDSRGALEWEAELLTQQIAQLTENLRRSIATRRLQLAHGRSEDGILASLEHKLARKQPAFEAMTSTDSERSSASEAVLPAARPALDAAIVRVSLAACSLADAAHVAVFEVGGKTLLQTRVRDFAANAFVVAIDKGCSEVLRMQVKDQADNVIGSSEALVTGVQGRSEEELSLKVPGIEGEMRMHLQNATSRLWPGDAKQGESSGLLWARVQGPVTGKEFVGGLLTHGCARAASDLEVLHILPGHSPFVLFKVNAGSWKGVQSFIDSMERWAQVLEAGEGLPREIMVRRSAANRSMSEDLKTSPARQRKPEVRAVRKQRSHPRGSDVESLVEGDEFFPHTGDEMSSQPTDVFSTPLQESQDLVSTVRRMASRLQDEGLLGTGDDGADQTLSQNLDEAYKGVKLLRCQTSPARELLWLDETVLEQMYRRSVSWLASKISLQQAYTGWRRFAARRTRAKRVAEAMERQSQSAALAKGLIRWLYAQLSVSAIADRLHLPVAARLSRALRRESYQDGSESAADTGPHTKWAELCVHSVQDIPKITHVAVHYPPQNRQGNLITLGTPICVPINLSGFTQVRWSVMMGTGSSVVTTALMAIPAASLPATIQVATDGQKEDRGSIIVCARLVGGEEAARSLDALSAGGDIVVHPKLTLRNSPEVLDRFGSLPEARLQRALLREKLRCRRLDVLVVAVAGAGVSHCVVDADNKSYVAVVGEVIGLDFSEGFACMSISLPNHLPCTTTIYEDNITTTPWIVQFGNKTSVTLFACLTDASKEPVDFHRLIPSLEDSLRFDPKPLDRVLKENTSDPVLTPVDDPDADPGRPSAAPDGVLSADEAEKPAAGAPSNLAVTVFSLSGTEETHVYSICAVVDESYPQKTPPHTAPAHGLPLNLYHRFDFPIADKAAVAAVKLYVKDETAKTAHSAVLYLLPLHLPPDGSFNVNIDGLISLRVAVAHQSKRGRGRVVSFKDDRKMKYRPTGSALLRERSGLSLAGDSENTLRGVSSPRAPVVPVNSPAQPSLLQQQTSLHGSSSSLRFEGFTPNDAQTPTTDDTRPHTFPTPTKSERKMHSSHLEKLITSPTLSFVSVDDSSDTKSHHEHATSVQSLPIKHLSSRKERKQKQLAITPQNSRPLSKESLLDVFGEAEPEPQKLTKQPSFASHISHIERTDKSLGSFLPSPNNSMGDLGASMNSIASSRSGFSSPPRKAPKRLLKQTLSLAPLPKDSLYDFQEAYLREMQKAEDDQHSERVFSPCSPCPPSVPMASPYPRQRPEPTFQRPETPPPPTPPGNPYPQCLFDTPPSPRYPPWHPSNLYAYPDPPAILIDSLSKQRSGTEKQVQIPASPLVSNPTDLVLSEVSDDAFSDPAVKLCVVVVASAGVANAGGKETRVSVCVDGRGTQYTNASEAGEWGESFVYPVSMAKCAVIVEVLRGEDEACLGQGVVVLETSRLPQGEVSAKLGGRVGVEEGGEVTGEVLLRFSLETRPRGGKHADPRSRGSSTTREVGTPARLPGAIEVEGIAFAPSEPNCCSDEARAKSPPPPQAAAPDSDGSRRSSSSDLGAVSVGTDRDHRPKEKHPHHHHHPPQLQQQQLQQLQQQQQKEKDESFPAPKHLGSFRGLPLAGLRPRGSPGSRHKSSPPGEPPAHAIEIGEMRKVVRSQFAIVRNEAVNTHSEFSMSLSSSLPYTTPGVKSSGSHHTFQPVPSRSVQVSTDDYLDDTRLIGNPSITAFEEACLEFMSERRAKLLSRMGRVRKGTGTCMRGDPPGGALETVENVEVAVSDGSATDSSLGEMEERRARQPAARDGQRSVRRKRKRGQGNDVRVRQLRSHRDAHARGSEVWRAFDQRIRELKQARPPSDVSSDSDRALHREYPIITIPIPVLQDTAATQTHGRGPVPGLSRALPGVLLRLLDERDRNEAQTDAWSQVDAEVIRSCELVRDGAQPDADRLPHDAFFPATVADLLHTRDTHEPSSPRWREADGSVRTVCEAEATRAAPAGATRPGPAVEDLLRELTDLLGTAAGAACLADPAAAVASVAGSPGAPALRQLLRLATPSAAACTQADIATGQTSPTSQASTHRHPAESIEMESDRKSPQRDQPARLQSSQASVGAQTTASLGGSDARASVGVQADADARGEGGEAPGLKRDATTEMSMLDVFELSLDAGAERTFRTPSTAAGASPALFPSDRPLPPAAAHASPLPSPAALPAARAPPQPARAACSTQTDAARDEPVAGRKLRVAEEAVAALREEVAHLSAENGRLAAAADELRAANGTLAAENDRNAAERRTAGPGALAGTSVSSSTPCADGLAALRSAAAPVLTRRNAASFPEAAWLEANERLVNLFLPPPPPGGSRKEVSFETPHGAGLTRRASYSAPGSPRGTRDGRRCDRALVEARKLLSKRDGFAYGSPPWLALNTCALDCWEQHAGRGNPASHHYAPSVAATIGALRGPPPGGCVRGEAVCVATQTDGLGEAARVEKRMTAAGASQYGTLPMEKVANELAREASGGTEMQGTVAMVRRPSWGDEVEVSTRGSVCSSAGRDHSWGDAWSGKSGFRGDGTTESCRDRVALREMVDFLIERPGETDAIPPATEQQSKPDDASDTQQDAEETSLGATVMQDSTEPYTPAHRRESDCQPLESTSKSGIRGGVSPSEPTCTPDYARPKRTTSWSRSSKEDTKSTQHKTTPDVGRPPSVQSSGGAASIRSEPTRTPGTATVKRAASWSKPGRQGDDAGKAAQSGGGAAVSEAGAGSAAAAAAKKKLPRSSSLRSSSEPVGKPRPAAGGRGDAMSATLPGRPQKKSPRATEKTPPKRRGSKQSLRASVKGSGPSSPKSARKAARSPAHTSSSSSSSRGAAAASVKPEGGVGESQRQPPAAGPRDALSATPAPHREGDGGLELSPDDRRAETAAAAAAAAGTRRAEHTSGPVTGRDAGAVHDRDEAAGPQVPGPAAAVAACPPIPGPSATAPTPAESSFAPEPVPADKPPQVSGPAAAVAVCPPIPGPSATAPTPAESSFAPEPGPTTTAPTTPAPATPAESAYPPEPEPITTAPATPAESFYARNPEPNPTATPHAASSHARPSPPPSPRAEGSDAEGSAAAARAMPLVLSGVDEVSELSENSSPSATGSPRREWVHEELVLPSRMAGLLKSIAKIGGLGLWKEVDDAVFDTWERLAPEREKTSDGLTDRQRGAWEERPALGFDDHSPRGARKPESLMMDVDVSTRGAREDIDVDDASFSPSSGHFDHRPGFAGAPQREVVFRRQPQNPAADRPPGSSDGSGEGDGAPGRAAYGGPLVGTRFEAWVRKRDENDENAAEWRGGDAELHGVLLDEIARLEAELAEHTEHTDRREKLARAAADYEEASRDVPSDHSASELLVAVEKMIDARDSMPASTPPASRLELDKLIAERWSIVEAFEQATHARQDAAERFVDSMLADPHLAAILAERHPQANPNPQAPEGQSRAGQDAARPDAGRQGQGQRPENARFSSPAVTVVLNADSESFSVPEWKTRLAEASGLPVAAVDVLRVSRGETVGITFRTSAGDSRQAEHLACQLARRFADPDDSIGGGVEVLDVDLGDAEEDGPRGGGSVPTSPKSGATGGRKESVASQYGCMVDTPAGSEWRDGASSKRGSLEGDRDGSVGRAGAAAGSGGCRVPDTFAWLVETRSGLVTELHEAYSCLQLGGDYAAKALLLLDQVLMRYLTEIERLHFGFPAVTTTSRITDAQLTRLLDHSSAASPTRLSRRPSASPHTDAFTISPPKTDDAFEQRSPSPPVAVSPR